MSTTHNPQSTIRILALDYGSVHTGAAICDPTGNIVRPLEVIAGAAAPDGLSQIADLVEREAVGRVIVGMPVSLSGKRGVQARETEKFMEELQEALSVPVLPWDERFTSKIAQQRVRGSETSRHSLAACCLLEDYLGSKEFLGSPGSSSP